MAKRSRERILQYTYALGPPVHIILRYTPKSSPLVKRFPRTTLGFPLPILLMHGSTSEACRSAAGMHVCVVLLSVISLLNS